MHHKLIIEANHGMSVINRNVLPEFFLLKQFIVPSVAKAAKKGRIIVTIVNNRHMQLLMDTIGA